MTKDIAIGLVVTIALALASFSLKWAFDANAEIQLLKQKLAQADSRRDDQEDKELRMLWKYTSWLHYQASLLRFKEGMEPAQNPDLNP